MALNRLTRILRAGRNKTAGRRQPRRDYCFVKLQKRNQNKTHLSSDGNPNLSGDTALYCRVQLAFHKAEAPSPSRTVGTQPPRSKINRAARRERPAQRSYETRESEVLRLN